MRIALYEPDIAQNTGAILRLCACLGIEARAFPPPTARCAAPAWITSTT
jgi:tRNA (cytidine/uridine-2'-O-)-methyltransferase